MLSNDTRIKIENIVKGNVVEGGQDTCTTIRNLLCTSFTSSPTVKKDFESKQLVKKEQAVFLGNYCKETNLWFTKLPIGGTYFAKGGEALVFLDKDGKSVLKLNDAIYYATWLEFFNSLLLHNLFFPNTAYTFLGFYFSEDILYAILKQPYIKSDSVVEIGDVKQHLEFNGFENHIRHDYKHEELGLLLEDMHDENVLVNSETLFFIDTVFYVLPSLNSK